MNITIAQELHEHLELGQILDWGKIRTLHLLEDRHACLVHIRREVELHNQEHAFINAKEATCAMLDSPPFVTPVKGATAVIEAHDEFALTFA